MDKIHIIQVVVFFIVLILAAVLYFVFQAHEKSQKKDRMFAVITKNSGVAAGEGGGKERSLAKQRAEISRKLKEAGQDEQKKKRGRITLRDLIQQAGIDISVSKFVITSAVLSSLFSGLIWMTNMAVPVKGLMVFVAFFGIPRMFLKFRAGRRQRKFLEEFADALEAMVRLLQAGMPVTEAVAMVSREFVGPVKEEMMRIYEDQKVGLRMGEAAERAAKRMPITEMKMFATAVQIQSETGSSLSEILMNLAGVIRSRFRLKRKVKALSSEAKSSAAIIAALPILVSLGLWGVNPGYIELLFTVKIGKMLLAGAITWMSIGILAMKQMINFKV